MRRKVNGANYISVRNRDNGVRATSRFLSGFAGILGSYVVDTTNVAIQTECLSGASSLFDSVQVVR